MKGMAFRGVRIGIGKIVFNVHTIHACVNVVYCCCCYVSLARGVMK